MVPTDFARRAERRVLDLAVKLDSACKVESGVLFLLSLARFSVAARDGLARGVVCKCMCLREVREAERPLGTGVPFL